MSQKNLSTLLNQTSTTISFSSQIPLTIHSTTYPGLSQSAHTIPREKVPENRQEKSIIDYASTTYDPKASDSFPVVYGEKSQAFGKVAEPKGEPSLPRVQDIDSLLNGVKLSLESTKKATVAYTVSEKEAGNVSKRIFDYYDRNRSGELETNEIGEMLKDLYKGIRPGFTPQASDISGLKRVFDKNGDGKVTIQDLESLVDRYLCVDNAHGVEGYYPHAKEAIKFNTNPLLFSSTFGKNIPADELSVLSGKSHVIGDLESNLINARRMFQRYDANKNNYVEQKEILPIIVDTFKMLNRDLLPSREDIELYLGMMDGNGDRKISMIEFEKFFIKACQRRNIAVPTK